MLIPLPAADLWRRLPEALDGRATLAPLPAEGAGGVLEMLRPDLPLEDADAALVVSTSGTTGAPKGVVLGRRALWASALATHERLGGPGTWTCVLPIQHVAGVMTLVRSHVAGTIAVFGRPDLSDLVRAPGRNYLSIVPTQLVRALADASLTATLAGYDAVLVGGAALSDAVAARARAHGVRLVTTYGMSETCGGCVYDGRPLAGVEVSDVDGCLEIAGAVVFSGYRGRPDLTANVLGADAAGRRRFRTSDRGSLVDGRVAVLGRLDDVVVTGGVNVDLAEVRRLAAELTGPPEEGGVLIVGVPDREWGTRIVAASTGLHDLAELRRRLADHLTSVALPKELRRVDGWPRTASGKIDLRAVASAWRVT